MGWLWVASRGRSRGVWVILAAACNGDDVAADGDDGSTGSSGIAESSTGDVEPDSSGGEPTSDSDVDESSGSSSSESSTGELPDVDPEPAGEGVAAGNGYSCAVEDGVLTCWGANSCGQLGDGTAFGKAPVSIAVDRQWASVATGTFHTCAIDADGGLWCWGGGSTGQLGTGELPVQLPASNCHDEPIAIEPGTAWARVSLSELHSCGVQTDGTLWCWGDNSFGQIGDGSVGPLYMRLVPTDVEGEHWIDVFAGAHHSCGLKSDGSVWCWGAGTALGVDGLKFSSTPVAVDLPRPMRALGRGGNADHTCAIADDGALWCWGAASVGEIGPGDPMGLPVEVDLGGAVEEVAVHGDTTCARRDDGTAHCLGRGSSGQFGDGMTGSEHTSSVPVQIPLADAAVSIAVGERHVCARTQDGVELCWGNNVGGAIGDGTSGPDNDRLQPTVAMPWGGGPIATGWTSIGVGPTHACAVRDGSLWCTGKRSLLGNTDPLEGCSNANPLECSVTTPIAVVAGGTWGTPTLGESHTCAIRDDATLWCWGANDSGQLGSEVEEASELPAQVGSASDWIAVEADGDTTCGIRSPGTLWCWGSNFWGQLGGGETGGSSSVPVQVGADVDWTNVSVGAYGNVCGLRAGGALSCWGRNEYGLLAQGDTGDPVATPTVVAGTWSSIAVAEFHACAIADDGTMWCWGRNEHGEVGAEAGDLTAVPVQFEADADWVALALGSMSSCGLRENGTAWCWGSNGYGQLGSDDVELGTTSASATMVGDIDDWVALAADESTFCAVRSDATALCWGSNDWGQQGNDTTFTSGTPLEVRDDA